MFARVRPDLVLDAGSNRGQFALTSVCCLPGIPVHSFEPLPSEAAVYRAVVPATALCVLHELALGETSGEAQIHVSGRRDSSSLLPIAELQSRIFPKTGEVGVQTVRVARLDDLPEIWKRFDRILLKLDVQGFELAVLKGAVEALRQCRYVYCECSEVELYRGQALSDEIRSFLLTHGFRPVMQFNPSHAEGRLVQADYLFERG